MQLTRRTSNNFFLSCRLRGSLQLAAIFLGILSIFPSANAHASGWVPIGPAPIKASPISSETGVEGMAASGNPAVGAMNVVLQASGSPNTMYVGTANGGVWKTVNGGISWVPVTDTLSSLSIGDMVFDRSDPGRLYIGFGKQSNYSSVGGPLNSIRMSADGGTTWTSPDTGNVLLGKDIVKMFVDTNLMLIGIKNPATGDTGLYRSTTGGGGLALVGTGTGLAPGVISDLKPDPLSAGTFYTSVVNGAATSDVFKSTDSGGTWSHLSLPNAGTDTRRILLATSGNTLVAGVVNGGAYNQTFFYRSVDGGANWIPMNQPFTQDPDKTNNLPYSGLFPGGQFNNAALAIDPSNRNIIYVSGDTQPENGTNAKFPNSIGANGYTGRLFRGVYDPATGETDWEPLTHIGTSTNSAPHPDSRSIFIDSMGRLVQTDDGGIYILTSPQGRGAWSSLNSNIQVSEVMASSWNPLANIAIAGMQDNGSAYQIKGSNEWGVLSGGDGGTNAVNWQTFGSQNIAVLYGSDQYMGTLVRIRMAADGSVDTSTMTSLGLYLIKNGSEIKLNENKEYIQFYPSLVLNRYDQTKMAVGGYGLYEGRDNPAISGVNGSEVKVYMRELVPKSSVTEIYNSGFNSIAYGAKDRPDAILAGIGDHSYGAYSDATIAANSLYGQLWYSDNATTTPPVRLVNYDTLTAGGTKPGRSVQSLVFDGRTGSANFYVSDGATIWRGTRNGNPLTLYDFNSIRGDLPAGFMAIRAVEYVSNNGVNALLAGGLHNSNTDTYVNPIYYTIDPAVKNGSNWKPLGKMLPNAPVFDLHYSDTDDVLLASTLGRGLFAMYDFTTYFTEATTLTFGLADNDSRPDLSQLTDGLADGTVFSRPLIKMGAGTLDMRGLQGFYSGGTQFRGGLVIAETENNFGSGGFLFDGGTLELTTGNGISRSISILGLGGTVITDNSPVLYLSGAVSGYGTLRYGGLLDITCVPIFSPSPQSALPLGSGITLLQADGGIYGQVNALEQPSMILPGTRYDVIYTPNALSFFVTPSSFTNLLSSGILLTASRTSVAAALQNIRPPHLSVPVGEKKLLFDSLYVQGASGLVSAYDQLGAASYAASVSAPLAAGRQAMNTLNLRMGQRSGATDQGQTRFAYNSIRVGELNSEVVLNDASPVSMPAAKNKSMVWGYGYGRFDQGYDDSVSPGYRMTTAGGMSGFDHAFGTGWLLGGAVGYARSSLDGNSNTGKSDVDSFQGMLYGGYGRESGPLLQLSAGGSVDSYSSRRSIQIGSYIASAGSSGDGNSLFSSISAGWRFAFNSASIEPLLSLDYTRLYRGGSQEYGSMVALTVQSASFNGLRLNEGVRGTISLKAPFGLIVTPEIRLGVAQELMDRNVTVQSLLAGQPISSESPRPGMDIFTGAIGVEVASSDHLAFHLEYATEMRAGADSHSVSGGFRFSW